MLYIKSMLKRLDVLHICFLLSCVTVGFYAEWTAWSSCSQSCDVGIQFRTRLTNGSSSRQEQYCNLQYCDDHGISCSGSCYSLEGMADCKEGQCVCSLSRRYKYDYSQYYNKQNCFPEVGNCIIRENPPFALAEVRSLKYGYKLRSCVTNDNPNYEVHVIGVYDRQGYNVIIRPRGETIKPLILVLVSYDLVTWRIDTSVHIDSIIYSILRSDSAQPVNILEQSKCGASNIVRFDDLGYTTGSDTGGGNTPKILLTLANLYGRVTSFSGIYKLYSPATIRLQVGGNPLQKISPDKFQSNTVPCHKVLPLYTTTSFAGTVVPTLPTNTDAEETSETSALVPVLVACTVSISVLCAIFFIVRKIYRCGNVQYEQRDYNQRVQDFQSVSNLRPHPLLSTISSRPNQRSPSPSFQPEPPSAPPSDGFILPHDLPPSYDSVVEHQHEWPASSVGHTPTESPPNSVPNAAILLSSDTDHSESFASQQTPIEAHTQLPLPRTRSNLTLDVPPTYESYIAMQQKHT